MATIGTDVIVEGTFRNLAGTLTTPTTYTVTYWLPDGTDQTINQVDIDIISTGVLQAVIPTTDDGVWRYTWNVTVGGFALVVAGSFCVDPIPVSVS